MSDLVLKDVQGVEVSVGDTISIATDKYAERGAMHDICVVEGVDASENTIYVQGGEDIDTTVYEVLVVKKFDEGT